MAAADIPAERTMFVRKATGLVKGWSVFDAFIYSAFAINLMALGFGYGLRRAQGSHPTLRGRRYPAASPARPTARAR